MANRVVLELGTSARNKRNSEGAFVTLASGRIVLIYTKYGVDHGDEGAAVLASRYSDDGGKTWTGRDRVVIQNEGKRNVMSVSLLRLHDGRILLGYLRKDGWGKCMPLVRFSDDELRTVSRPRSVLIEPGYHVLNNDRIVQLTSGRLIAPVALHRQTRPITLHETGRRGTTMTGAALILYGLSDDGGRSWFESTNAIYKGFTNGVGMQEPGVVELADGRLWSWARAGGEHLDGTGTYQWQMFSDDGGCTWSEAARSGFISPCSPMSVKRIPSTGDLLAVWNDISGRYKVKAAERSWRRTPLVCAVSGNEGKTWRHHKALEKEPSRGYCYTAIHFVGDAVLLGYCAGGGRDGMVLDTLRVRRMSIDALYG
ncbi:MAG: sialidase [Planctomycetaceae bacterium]|nr:sialidase [Planctomycetaceae bacterium]